MLLVPLSRSGKGRFDKNRPGRNLDSLLCPCRTVRYYCTPEMRFMPMTRATIEGGIL